MEKLQKITTTTSVTYFINPNRITLIDPQKNGTYLVYTDTKWLNDRNITLTISEDEARKFAEIGDYVVGTL